MRLIAAMVRLGRQYDMKECYADCIPALLHYYKAIGFSVSADKFIHRENGLSYPLRLDLVRHGAKLSRDATLIDYAHLFLKAKALKWGEAIQSSLSRPAHP